MQGRARKRDVGVEGARYLREPRPVHFPSEETVPESKRHLMLRTALFQTLSREFCGRFAIGSDQFVYWNARDPGVRLAPDVFVCTSMPDSVFDSWKTWERGAPQLAVEIISDSDAGETEWDRKLERYLEAGVQELVRFDPSAPQGKLLRTWDRIDGDLVERVVSHDRTVCETLQLHWVVVAHVELGCMLRLARDAAGEQLLLSPEEERDLEARLRGEEARLRGEEARLRGEEARLRREAEQRAAELEARLRELTDKQ